MRLLRSKPSFSAFWGASTGAHDHLRISEDLVSAGPGSPEIEDEDEEEIETLYPTPAVQCEAGGALQDKYDRSVERIEGSIYTLATAVSALDTVEAKLMQVRDQIDTLRRRGTPVDGAKVRRSLLQLADHVNTTITAMDRHGVNLLRDSRVAIRLSEIDAEATREVGVELTLISLDKLMAYRLKDGSLSEEEAIDVIEGFSSVVLNNVQVLSSAILALLASRDYTDDVTRLVLAEGIAQRAGRGVSIDAWPAGEGHPRLEPPRRSLVSLIDRIRDGG